jgi:hypothetical protein
VLIITALVVSAIGIAIEVDPESPFLFPAVPGEAPETPPTLAQLDEPGSRSSLLSADPSGYDPFGDTFPNPESLGLILDGVGATTWRTDTYFGPLVGVKPGIGIVFEVDGDPRFLEIIASPGTNYDVMWSDSLPDRFEDWRRLWAGTTLEGPNVVRLPDRSGGTWLLWLTGLPEQGNGQYFTEITDVRFVQ